MWTGAQLEPTGLKVLKFSFAVSRKDGMIVIGKDEYNAFLQSQIEHTEAEVIFGYREKMLQSLCL